MNIFQLLIGIILILWAILYYWFIQRQLKPFPKSGIETEGHVLRCIDEEEKSTLEIKIRMNDEEVLTYAPLLREEDRLCVGKNVYLLLDNVDYTKSQIDYDKELNVNSKTRKKAGLQTSIILAFVGILLIVYSF